MLDTEPSVAFTLVQHATTELHSMAARLVIELHFACSFSKVTELLFFSNLLDIQGAFTQLEFARFGQMFTFLWPRHKLESSQKTLF